MRTDGPVEVTLEGAIGASAFDSSGDPWPLTRDEGRDLVVTLPEAGEFVVVVRS